MGGHSSLLFSTYFNNCKPSFYTGLKNWVWCITWSPDGKKLVSGNNAEELQCWDLQMGRPPGNPLLYVKSLLWENVASLFKFWLFAEFSHWFFFKKLCFQKVDIPSHSSNIGNWNLLCIRVRRNGLMVAWEPVHLDASYCQFVSPSKLNLRPICHNTEKKHWMILSINPLSLRTLSRTPRVLV